MRSWLTLKLWHKELASVDHAPEVDAHQPLEILKRDLGERPVKRHSSVVDQNRRPAEIPFHLFGKSFDRGSIGYIHEVGPGLGAYPILSGEHPLHLPVAVEDPAIYAAIFGGDLPLAQESWEGGDERWDAGDDAAAQGVCVR